MTWKILNYGKEWWLTREKRMGLQRTRNWKVSIHVIWNSLVVSGVTGEQIRPTQQHTEIEGTLYRHHNVSYNILLSLLRTLFNYTAWLGFCLHFLLGRNFGTCTYCVKNFIRLIGSPGQLPSDETITLQWLETTVHIREWKFSPCSNVHKCEPPRMVTANLRWQHWLEFNLA